MAACVEPYSPPTITEDADYLVVDGFLNVTTGIASVKLTRSIRLSDAIPVPAEARAIVTIENEGGEVISLSEEKDGIYQAHNLTFATSKDYRLRIKTKGGSSYTSDYVTLRQSPILDSVVWRPGPTGITFYVNAHDPLNQTTYYKYLFTETWEYRARYNSAFKKVDGRPVFRKPYEQVYTCWNSSISTQILTTSTKRLSTDIVSMFPINFIRRGSLLLGRTYSINVQQRAISQQEFEYWDLIRKTTESLGGLFDPMPSQVLGNVHNDNDSDEKILGFFSGGSVQEKRIFVLFYDLPDYLLTTDQRDFICELSSVPVTHLELAGENVFVEQLGQPPSAYTIGSPVCADCRTLGGDTLKPKYWPQ